MKEKDAHTNACWSNVAVLVTEPLLNQLYYGILVWTEKRHFFSFLHIFSFEKEKRKEKRTSILIIIVTTTFQPKFVQNIQPSWLKQLPNNPVWFFQVSLNDCNSSAITCQHCCHGWPCHSRPNDDDLWVTAGKLLLGCFYLRWSLQ